MLKRELKSHFLTGNVKWLAREGLKKLKHIGLVRDYVREFSLLMLDIMNMLDEDKLFNFISGLQSWVKKELRRQAMRDLPAAIATAVDLVNFRFVNASPFESEKSNEGKKSHSSCVWWEEEQWPKQSQAREFAGEKEFGVLHLRWTTSNQGMSEREKLNTFGGRSGNSAHEPITIAEQHKS